MSLQKVVDRVRELMEEADCVLDAPGPTKKKYVQETIRAITESLMDESEANLVNGLVGPMVDLIVAASRGDIKINIPKPRCRWPPCS